MSYLVLLNEPNYSDMDYDLPIHPAHLLKNYLEHHRRPNYYRPWKSQVSHRDTGSLVSADKDKFQISLDVQQFRPEEISVKAVDDKQIVIEGKHEERQDEHGFISRQFSRRYILPDGHDVNNIISNLSSDGVLTITAPKLDTKPVERIVPITHTGPVRTQKQPEKIEDKKSE